MRITVLQPFAGLEGRQYQAGRQEITAEDAQALATWACEMEDVRNRREWTAPLGFESGNWPPFRFEPETGAAPLWEPSN